MATDFYTGRIILAEFSAPKAEAVSEYLTYHGVESLICRCEENDSYLVTVTEADKDRAAKLLAKFEETAKPKKSGLVTIINEKLGDITVSATLFIICGGIVFVLALLRVFSIMDSGETLVVSETVRNIIIWLELILGFFFLIFGIRILLKARQARIRLRAESARTLSILTWFLGTYSPDDLDRLVEAKESDASPADQRREIIRSFIVREYSIEDEKYLDYLTEETYTAMYHTRKFNK